ncbi:hypothetical protein Pmani_000490 [Petrolisthes manimaculis]|uniref:C3H1-type domain-containing protein n=1 Tax=Petrolisthes manimaculis TaxID=1843537 RepID=A0AAE1ULA2_9EUCA|nr:hypothetical protein Pmani_000481 [Petrolisthes manimaculis]KAK4329144.1 hypothetical protein Pmani_000486 [Petrolisthes manimaculis]KAK4329148.1 hypothetical protein Pmani_000490 [Petrolisthes manimaculis]
MAAPSENKNNSDTIACGICGESEIMKYSIQCDCCKKWMHYHCTHLPIYMINKLRKTAIKFDCVNCCDVDGDWEKEAVEGIEKQKLLLKADKTRTGNEIKHDNAPTPAENQDIPSANQQEFQLGSTPENIDLNCSLGPTSEQVQTPEDNNILTIAKPSLPQTSGSISTQGESSQTPSNNPREPAAQPTDTAGEQNREKLVCLYYKKGICRHGIAGKECIYSHPKPCRRLMEHGIKGKHGCKRDNKCRWFHPRLCYNSLMHHECFADSCRKFHVKGTRTKRTHDAQQAQKTQTYTNTSGETNRVTEPKTQAPNTVPGMEANQGKAFLDLMIEMKSTMDALTKTVASQEMLLSNIVKGSKPNWVPAGLPQPGQNSQQFPWMAALTSH